MKSYLPIHLFLLMSVIGTIIIGGCKPEHTGTVEKITQKNFVYRVNIEGPITPANQELLFSAIEKAENSEAKALLVVLDTPGGLMSSMDDMVRRIMSSKIPVITHVGPPGASCGSAGVFILYSSHLASMAPATNIGSATPIMTGSPGGGSPQDEKEEKPQSDRIPETAGANDALNLKRKLFNHAKAQIRGLAEYHGRNANFGERTITHAANVTSNEALDLGAIEIVAETEQELLNRANGRKVHMLTGIEILETADVQIVPIDQDVRTEFLKVLSNPNLAYILMMIGMLGIMAEIQYPGSIFPGVIGGISLLLGLYAMQTLPINYAGIGLIILGLIFLVIEVMVQSMGLLAIGGIVSMLVGSFMLVDSSDEMVRLSTSVIFGTTFIVATTTIFIVYKAAGAIRKMPTSGDNQLVTETGISTSEITVTTGKVYIHSEYWNARSKGDLIPKGTPVKVIGREGMTLIVDVV